VVAALVRTVAVPWALRRRRPSEARPARFPGWPV